MTRSTWSSRKKKNAVQFCPSRRFNSVNAEYNLLIYCFQCYGIRPLELITSLRSGVKKGVFTLPRVGQRSVVDRSQLLYEPVFRTNYTGYLWVDRMNRSGSRSVLAQWFVGGTGGGGESFASCWSADDDDADDAVVAALPRIMVLDGGVSTHLLSDELCGTRAGCGGGPERFKYKELWSSSLLLTAAGQQRIRQGHLDWLCRARANVISTVTYQLHYEATLWPASLQPNWQEEKVTELWETGIALARDAQQEYCEQSSSETSSNTARTTTPTRPTFVIASSGCYGSALSNGAEYTGDYGFGNNDNIKEEEDARQRLCEFHRKKLIVVSTVAGADLTAIETVPSLLECTALAQLLLQQAAEEESPPTTNNDGGGYCCYISFSCRNESQLHDGTPLQDALKVFRSVPPQRLVAFGLNCCAVQHLAGLLTILLTELQQYQPRRGVVLYPNSGETWDSASATWQHDGSSDAVWVEALMDRIRQIEASAYWLSPLPSSSPSTGTSTASPLRPPGILVGGCCRTTPVTIALLQRQVQDHLAAGRNGHPSPHDDGVVVSSP
jgi:homocysteine S-methyltransferase